MNTTRIGSLLILTEDGAEGAHETITAVVKRMLQLVVPECQTHRIGFEPKDEQAQRAVQGTGWKQKPASCEFRETLRTIATRLGRADGFVFFHIDGDKIWSKQDTSENKAKWKTHVEEPVRLILERFSNRPVDVEALLERLFRIMPFYSIEAWLYQNTDVAIRICRDKYQGRHIHLFEQWRNDRTALDEVDKPKKQVQLEGNHNLEFARVGFPADSVRAAACSYAACVEQLMQCEELKKLLEATNSWGGSTP